VQDPDGVTDVIVDTRFLQNAPFEQLQELADRVGVGYAGLNEEGLRQKLTLEGVPSQ